MSGRTPWIRILSDKQLEELRQYLIQINRELSSSEKERLERVVAEGERRERREKERRGKTEWRVWRRKKPLIVGGKEREVRYLVPDGSILKTQEGEYLFLPDCQIGEATSEIPIMAIRNTAYDREDIRPIPSGTFPAEGLLKLYEPVED